MNPLPTASQDLIDISFPPAIDSTMLSMFDACPQKFLMEFILRKVPIGRSIHLHAGGCVARATELIRIYYYRDGLPLEECFIKTFPAYAKMWGDFQAPEKEYKDFVNCWCAVEAYFKEYPPATDYFQPYMNTDGSPAVEFKFSVPMNISHPDTGDPLMFAGRFDMLSQPHDQKVCYVVDEKTSKSLGASWQYQWNMRGQFFGYTRSSQACGYPAVGALVRGIAIQQTQFGFQEKLVMFTEEQLDEWWHTAHKKAGQMVQMYEISKAMYNPGSLVAQKSLHTTWTKSYGDACSSYGGCQFMDLCTHPEPWHIYRDYERRVWNPLAHDPTEESEDRLSEMGEISFAEFMAGA